MALDDVVGYIYRAEILCPACTIAALYREGRASRTAYLDTRPSDNITAQIAAEHHGAPPPMPVEEALTQIAGAEGIDREDERSFDSGDFPKVVFRSVAIEAADAGDEDAEVCHHCGETTI